MRVFFFNFNPDVYFGYFLHYRDILYVSIINIISIIVFSRVLASRLLDAASLCNSWDFVSKRFLKDVEVFFLDFTSSFYSHRSFLLLVLRVIWELKKTIKFLFCRCTERSIRFYPVATMYDCVYYRNGQRGSQFVKYAALF